MTTVSSVFDDCARGMRAEIIGIRRRLDVDEFVLLVRALVATRDASTQFSVLSAPASSPRAEAL